MSLEPPLNFNSRRDNSQFGEFVLKAQLVKEKAASTTRMVFIDGLCERRE